MAWQGVDFLGISLNDRSLVKKLDEYLKTHEEYISHALVHQFRNFTGGTDTMVVSSAPIQFDEAVKEAHSLLQEALAGGRMPKEKEQRHLLVKTVNAMLWEQVELVEGFVNELFHQLSYISVLKWQPSLKDIVEGFSQVLHQHIQVTKKCVIALRDLLKTVFSSAGGEGRGWAAFFLRFRDSGDNIDKELVSDLQVCEKALKKLTDSFIDQFTQYEKVSLEVSENSHKLKGYEVLYSLGAGYGEQYESLYRFVKIWSGVDATHTATQEALLRSFQYFSRDKTFGLLSSYYKALELSLYEKSRTLKTSPKHLFSDMLGRTFIIETVKGYRKEVHTLGSVVNKLIDFLLKSDPDPYIRSRWGFTDAPVGEPPKYIKKLNDLALDIEYLDHNYGKLLESLERGPKDGEGERIESVDAQLSRILHLVAQPLMTVSHYKSYAEKALDLLDSVDELGSYGRESVDYVRLVLGRLLRSDWKEHLLTTLSHFRRVYRMHQGIIGQSIDKAHEKRYERFSQLLEQVKRKIRSPDMAQEIDFDINDIKGYLQDFLATLQRTLNDESITQKRAIRHIEEAAQQLLEYRYLFGEFFASLKSEPEGYYIRQQFLFADQYFEALENKIYEIRLQRGLVVAEEG